MAIQLVVSFHTSMTSSQNKVRKLYKARIFKARVLIGTYKVSHFYPNTLASECV